jgi:hypothetical protein
VRAIWRFFTPVAAKLSDDRPAYVRRHVSKHGASSSSGEVVMAAWARSGREAARSGEFVMPCQKKISLEDLVFFVQFRFLISVFM